MVPFEMGMQKTQARTSSLRKNQRLSFQLERNGETEETTHRGQLNFVGRMESGSMANSFHTLSSGAAKRLQHSPHLDGEEKENNDVSKKKKTKKNQNEELPGTRFWPGTNPFKEALRSEMYLRASILDLFS